MFESQREIYLDGLLPKNLEKVCPCGDELGKSTTDKMVHFIVLFDFDWNPDWVNRGLDETLFLVASGNDDRFKDHGLVGFVMIVHFNFWFIMLFDQFTGEASQTQHWLQRLFDSTQIAFNTLEKSWMEGGERAHHFVDLTKWILYKIKS